MNRAQGEERMQRIRIGLTGLAFVFLLVLLGTAISRSSEDNVVSPSQNELAADSKYQGKTLRITGRIDKIDTDIWDDEKYILRLGGKWDIVGVNCNDMPTEELATLKQGQNVTVIGQFDDGGDLGVEVADCRLA